MTPEEQQYLDASNQTSNDLYLASLGDFEDDPAADDVYFFALKSNENMLKLDDTMTKANNNTSDIESLRSRGLFEIAAYGGRLNVPVN